MSQEDFAGQDPNAQLLKLLDSSARCGICCQLYDAPLCLKTCGHSFCSACIRQNLNFQERSGSPACPVCRAPCDNRDLQANLSLRELVEGYTAARPALLRLLRSAEQQQAAAARQQPRRRVGKRAAAAEPEAELEEDGEGRGAAEVAQRRSFRRSTAAAAAAAAPSPAGNAAAAAAAGPAARRPVSQAGQATQRLDRQTDCSEQVAAAVAPRRRLRSRAYADALPASAAEVIGDSDCEDPPPAQQQSDDADGQPESDYCIEVLDSGSDGAALSSGEEFAASEREDSEASEGLLSSPSPPDKRRRRSRSQSQRGDARRQSMQQRQGKGRGSEAAAGGGGHSQGATDAPQGFVSCCICGRAVPDWYINSHIDQCLGGGAGAGASGSGDVKPTQRFPPSQATATAATTVAAAAAAKEESGPAPTSQRPFQALALPPKLVAILTSEKALRAALKQYGLPVDGKKPELLDRYNAFRLEVESANDRQERTTYSRLAQRVAAAGRQRAVASLLGRSGNGHASSSGASRGQGGGTGAGAGPSSAVGSRDHCRSSAVAGAGGGVVVGSSFKQLIAATKARDAARRAARAAAAAATPVVQHTEGAAVPAALEQQQQQQQQQGEEEESKREGHSTPEEGWPEDSPLMQRPPPLHPPLPPTTTLAQSPEQRKEQSHPNAGMGAAAGKATAAIAAAAAKPPSPLQCGGQAQGAPAGRLSGSALAAEVRAATEVMLGGGEEEDWS